MWKRSSYDQSFVQIVYKFSENVYLLKMPEIWHEKSNVFNDVQWKYYSVLKTGYTLPSFSEYGKVHAYFTHDFVHLIWLLDKCICSPLDEPKDHIRKE